MSYFDNANNRVTRKSFGSRVDKEFKREGVIPVRDRKKDERDLVAEAAKQQELDKKVRDTRLEELKNKKAYEDALQEGYSSLKDDLMKEFISSICVEALLVDEQVVNENLHNILEMVETKVDELGGFNGVKKIATTNRNPVLMNIVSVCETTAKKVGERNAREAENRADKVNFQLNKIELEEYDYKKREIGADTIVNNIKDKVFQVVQDEQKLSNDRQMVMQDIQNKVTELEAPVEEAMQFVFESAGIEEETLFGSMMRSHYKQLLESNSSPIFESFDYKDEEGPAFEDSEFDIEDISMIDMDEDDKKEIEDTFINECKVLLNIEDDEYETTLENIYNLVLEGSQNIIAKNQAEHFNHIVRRVQECLEYVEEKYVKNIQKHARKISDKKLDKSIARWEREIEETRNKIKTGKDEVAVDDYREDLRILTAELKALKAEKDHRGKQLKIAKEANPYMKSTMETADDVRERLIDKARDKKDVEEVADISANGNLSKADMKDIDIKTKADLKSLEKSTKPTSEEVIICPSCGKDPCVCQPAKESLGMFEDDIVEENIVVNKMAKVMNDAMYKKIAKRDFDTVRGNLSARIEGIKTTQELDLLAADFKLGVEQLKEAGRRHPEHKQKLDKHIKWLQTDGKKMLDEQRKYIEQSGKVKESVDMIDFYIDKLEGISETMTNILEAHEDAENLVIESLTKEINGEITLVPYLQTNDVNLNNLQFVYKTKTVCESLKNNLKYIETNQEANTLKRAVELNISSINETLEVIKDREDMEHKAKILKKGKAYLSRILENLEYNNYSDEIKDDGVLGTPEAIEEAFERVREYTVIESTDNDIMEVVMAEAIVEYTILETLNTMNLIRYTKDSVRQMARKNISK